MARSQIILKVFSGRNKFIWLAAGLCAGLAATLMMSNPWSASAQDQQAQKTGTEDLVVVPTEVDFNKSSTVWIYGSGFNPGTVITLLVQDGNGVLTDITSESSVFPLKVNKQGAFATSWTLGDFTKKGVGIESMQTMWAADSNFNMLASAPIALCNISERKKAATATPAPGAGTVTPVPGQATVTPLPGTATPGGPGAPTPAPTPTVPSWCSK